MPKVVDHEERKAEIITALFRVAERDGLAAATYRVIASEAGIPAPQVQYYFATKSELIQAALFELGRRVIGRGIALMNEAGPDPSPEFKIRSAVRGAHPADRESRQDLVLFYLFYVAALSDSAIANRTLLDAQRFITATFAEWISDAQAAGSVAPDVDPVHEGRLVLFANTGLMLGALVGIHTVDDAAATMDYMLTRLFTAA